MKKQIAAILTIGREECTTDIDMTMVEVFEEIGRCLANENDYPNEVYNYRNAVSGLSAATLKKIVEHYETDTLFDYIHGSDHTRLLLEFMNFNKLNADDFRAKFPKAYKKWSEEDDAILLESRRNGASLTKLAKELDRNVNAIKIRLEKLGAGDEETKSATMRFPWRK